MNTSKHRAGRRPLALACATALTLSLLPGVAAADSHDTPMAESRGIDRVCPAPADDTVTAAGYTDTSGTTHEQSIMCASDYGLVRGYPDETYRPLMAATRAQIATFVAGWLETATGNDLAVPDDDAFTDIAGSVHADAINALEAAGVVRGRADDTFGPGELVTRGQMAALIARAIDVADDGETSGSLPAPSDAEFFDDAVGTTFQADIQALAAVGIVQGNDGRYAPNAPVTRGQLASFLLRGADYLDREQRWEPTAVVVTYDVALAGMNEIGDDGLPGAGQSMADGTAGLVIDAFAGTLDVDLEFGEVDGPFGVAPGAHIHIAPIGENGSVVIPLATGAELEAATDGTFSTQIMEDVDAVRLADLVEMPDLFYVNIHSDGFPDGAIRGQLPDGGQDLLAPATYMVTMLGENEVDAEGAGGVGDLGASAEADVVIDALAGTIEYTLDLSGVDGPFDEAPGFHIHVGEAGVNGGIVAFLATGADVAAAADDDGMLTGTFDAEAAVIRNIVRDPAGYYLNLHSNAFPAGAVRAQLE